MKTSLFKIVMPTIAILLAVGGSFASNASEKATSTILPGYIIPLGGSICQNFTTCENILSPWICTLVYQGIPYQAYGKMSPQDTVCDIILYKGSPF